jgi:RNA polymerase sigma-70 factor, ECF subfamily
MPEFQRIMNSADHFEAIVNEHYKSLYRFALSLTHAESDACDLTQQTFYVWAIKGHEMRDLTKAKSWLFTTLYRAFLVTKRKRCKFSNLDLDGEASEKLVSNSPEPAARADVCEVLPALAKVDENFRAAVALFYLDECSYSEIAAILEVPIGTVKSRISRGIAQLRDILQSNDSEGAYRKWDGSATLLAEPLADF